MLSKHYHMNKQDVKVSEKVSKPARLSGYSLSGNYGKFVVVYVNTNFSYTEYTVV